MNTTLSIVVWLTIAPIAGAMDPSDHQVGAKERKQPRHAYYFYTAAISEEDDATRMKLFTRAIQLDPNLYRAYYNRGVLYARKDDRKRASADFAKATQLNPNYMYAHYNLACILALDNLRDQALTSLEHAFKNGYRKFDKVKQDKDLSSVASLPAFARLVTRYEELEKETPPTPIQQMQTGTRNQRVEILIAEIEKPTAGAQTLADWAMYEPDPAVRTLAMQLWKALDRKQSRQRLASGLYDVNGYVRKAAANALVSYGKDVADTVRPILADKDLGVAFYAMQILAAVDDRDSAGAIVPYLKADDTNIRIIAAQSLAKLKAVSALPHLKAALDKLPEDRRDREFYQASLRKAIATLEKLDPKNCK